MFKLQHINEPAGPFGYSVYDRQSSYRGVLPPLYLVYKLFGINTIAFYFEGIIAYFLASLSVYVLAFALTKDKKVSFVASLLFASGFVGAETLWRIFNSVHTSHAIIFTCLTLALYKKFVDYKGKVKTKKILFYLASLLLFAYTVETGLVRAHGIIILVVFLELLWNFRLLKSALRLLPFGIIYYLFYIADNTSRHELGDLLGQIIVGQNFDLLTYPLKNLQNIILPSVWRLPLVLFILGVAIIFALLKGKRKILIYSFVIMMAGYLVYFVHTPTQIFPSIHRYFSISAVGSSLFIALVITSLVKNKRVIYSLVAVVVAIHLILVNRENIDFINSKTIPTRNFYSTLKREIPNLSKGSIFYFDIAEDAKSIDQFGNSFGVGSMPDTTAIAWQYSIDRSDIVIARDYKEVLSRAKEAKSIINSIYTFYFDSERGLVNTTKTTRDSLFGNKKAVNVPDESIINFSYSLPLKMSFNATALLDENNIKYSKSSIPFLGTYFDYLDSKKTYFKSVKVDSSTYWENLIANNMIDGKTETFWKGDRLKWHYNHSESVVVTVKKPLVVGAIKMTNKYIDSTPQDYKYYCSLDGKNWQSLGEYYYKPNKDADFVIDKIPSAKLCKFIKMDVISTNGDDSPRIAEIEVIEDRFKNIDFSIAQELQYDPFKYISSKKDLETVLRFLRTSGMTAKFCYLTDKSVNPFCEDFNFMPFSTRIYTILVPPNGTTLKSIEIEVPKSFGIKIKNLMLNPNVLE